MTDPITEIKIIKPHDCGTCALSVPIGRPGYAGIIPTDCALMLKTETVRDVWGSRLHRATNCPLDNLTIIDLRKEEDL